MDARTATYANWKIRFKNICDEPVQETCTPSENISYLEQRGKIGVGKYDKLIEIFQEYDQSAVNRIKFAISELQNLPSNS